jgi:hypothetical protein
MVESFRGCCHKSSMSYPHWPPSHYNEAIDQLHCLLGYSFSHRKHLLHGWRSNLWRRSNVWTRSDTTIISLLDNLCVEPDDGMKTPTMHPPVQLSEADPVETKSVNTDLCPCQRWNCTCQGYSRYPSHGSFNWAFCYEDTCPIHRSDKEGAGYWPKPPRGWLKPRWELMPGSR